MKLGQKSVENLVGFLGDLKTPKFHSEINWPLSVPSISFHFFFFAFSLLFFNSSCFMEQMVVELRSKKQPALLIIIPLFWYLPCYVLYVFDHHWNAIFGRKSLDDRGLHSSHIFEAWPTMLSRPLLLPLFSVQTNYYYKYPWFWKTTTFKKDYFVWKGWSNSERTKQMEQKLGFLSKVNI